MAKPHMRGGGPSESHTQKYSRTKNDYMSWIQNKDTLNRLFVSFHYSEQSY